MDPSHFSLLLEETRLITALSSVRSQLNEYAPIFILPPEILEDIFTLCIAWLFLPQKNPHPLAWTQVCRKWRYISLNTPRLWSYIDVCDDHLAAECLNRSADVPLHIISSSLYWKFTANVTLLIPHLDRITSINILLFPEDIAYLLSMCPSLPNLTVLSLKVPPVASNFLLDFSSGPARLTSLRRLTLWSVSVPWTICVGLTYIHLRGLAAGYSPTIEQLLGIFGASPCIEEIHLEHVTPIPTESDPPHGLSLPTLRHLRLTSKSPFKIHTLFSYLSLPPSAHLSIVCPHFERLHDLFPGTRPRTLFPHLSSEVGIEIEHSREGFSLFTSNSTKSLNPGHESKFISVRTQHPSTNLQALLSDIVLFFDIDSITPLNLDVDRDGQTSSFHTLPKGTTPSLPSSMNL